jgi:site-specific recombinase XerD
MLSERTIQEYYFDIRLFLKYICCTKNNTDADIMDADISKMSADDFKKISVADIYNFIFYASDERQNSTYARYRKISSLRSFFNYLSVTAHIIDIDPTKNLDIPAPKNALPKYLSLNESLELLKIADTNESKRNYCIITLFLNCGMRLSELVGINISDIDFEENRVKVLGKGHKERMVYLNAACIDALNEYLQIRKNNLKAKNEPALFISNQNKRISKRRVQQIVEDTITKAGLDGKGITTHKLRHTAATLMYQYGDVDVLTLKELLGHANVSTTEIYTHLNNDMVRNAVESNPLANINHKKDK